MEIIKWKPLSELEHFFDDQSLFTLRKIGADFAVDVYEENRNIIAKMILPDINPSTVDISIEENTLTVSGRRDEEKETKQKDYYSKEIRRGMFSRSIPLPKHVDATKAVADYRNGMLTVTMPALGNPKKKSVQINISS